MKRIIDILGSILGLLFIAPFFPLIALAIFTEDGRPIIVKLDRVSQGKVIKIYKFRSMKRGAEKEKVFLSHLNGRNDGPFFKAENDPRITKVGKFLRRTRLDEFPQFLNVLKSELSLVGPRPHEPEEMLKYPPEYQKIFLAKSGLTGISQITAAPYLLFQTELELDLYYIENQSILSDLKIIWKTLLIFLTRPDGI